MLQPSKYQVESQRFNASLQQVWESDGFAWTIQLSSSLIFQGAGVFVNAATLLKEYDAVLVADEPDGSVTLSTLAQAILFQRTGLTAIAQISGRDKNRIALQSEILGLSALNVPYVLVDTRTVSRAHLAQNADARLVAELQGSALLALATRMRDKARFFSGATIKTPPTFSLGALVDLEELCPLEDLYSTQFLVTAPVINPQRLANLLPGLLSIYADLLKARPLLVSVPLMLHHSGEAPGDTGELLEREQESYRSIIQLLKESKGVRGCNIVVERPVDLATLKQATDFRRLHSEK